MRMYSTVDKKIFTLPVFLRSRHIKPIQNHRDQTVATDKKYEFSYPILSKQPNRLVISGSGNDMARNQRISNVMRNGFLFV